MVITGYFIWDLKNSTNQLDVIFMGVTKTWLNPAC